MYLCRGNAKSSFVNVPSSTSRSPTKCFQLRRSHTTAINVRTLDGWLCEDFFDNPLSCLSNGLSSCAAHWPILPTFCLVLPSSQGFPEQPVFLLLHYRQFQFTFTSTSIVSTVLVHCKRSMSAFHVRPPVLPSTVPLVLPSPVSPYLSLRCTSSANSHKFALEMHQQSIYIQYP
jgi:hypothetical protein